MEEGCVASLVKIKGTLADIEKITARVFDRPALKGSITLPKSLAGDPYGGPYEVTPNPENDIVLATRKKSMLDDVTVFKIPYYETSNESGYTVYIGNEV